MRLTHQTVRQQAEDLKAIRLTRLQGSNDYYAIVVGIEDTLKKLATLMPKIEHLCIHVEAVRPEDATGEEVIAQELCETYRKQFEEGW